MIHRQPAYYAHFRCLGGSCPDTCCQDWDIVLDEKTIADYRAAPPPLSARLKASLTTDQDGDTCFRLDEHGRCTMLTEDGLCAIQKEWGEAHLCGHCRAYPRFIEEYGSLTETSLALSCPEVARLLLTAPSFQVMQEDDGQPDLPFLDIPMQFLEGLDISRQQALTRMEQDQGPIWASIQDVLSMANALQSMIDTLEYSLLTEPIAIVSIQPSSASCRTFTQTLCRLFASLEPLRASWPQRLEQCRQRLEQLTEEEYQSLCRAFEAHVPQWQRHLTNVTEYLIFRHWHKTVNDDQLYPRAAFIASSAVLLYHLFLVQWDQSGNLTLEDEITICCAFSREVEHMEENLERAIDACSSLIPSAIPYPIH